MSISVIIPTHNRPDALAAAVKSVFNQTLLPKELIVVDDGSNPPANSDVFPTCQEGMETKLLRNETPKGANNARNQGIMEATGEWIAFLDDDDEFKPEKLEKLAETLNQEIETDIIYHPAEINMVTERITYTSGSHEFSKSSSHLNQILIHNFVGGTSMVIVKKSALLDVGCFDEAMPALQDWEMWIRMATAKKMFYFLNRVLTRYTLNTSVKNLTMNDDKAEQAFKLIEIKYKPHYQTLARSERRRVKYFKLKNKIFKALLHKKINRVAVLQLQLFVNFLKLSDLALLIVLPLGVKNIFKLRSYLP